MRVEDVTPYVGKVCVLDFMNGTIPLMTKIVSIDGDFINTKELIIVAPDPKNPHGGFNFIPYGAHFPHTEPSKSARLEIKDIKMILNPQKPFADKYEEFTSPIKKVSGLDLGQIDLSKFTKQLNG